MGETGHDGLAVPGRVVLAREPDFTLGAAVVHPSTLQVESGGQVESLEPRMMQVLVALARADGQVVTREDLVEQCWDGRVVGEDAINRVIWRLRQLSRGLGPGTFQVETIARVGFRLEVAQDARRAAKSKPIRGGGPFGWPSRRALISGGAAVIGLAALGAFAFGGGNEHSPDPRAKRFYDRAMQLRGQASMTQAEQSIAYLKEATRIDPDYADAWGALAWAYRSLPEYGPRADSKRLSIAARSAADRALDLDSSNPDAGATLVLLEPRFRRWAEVEKGLRDILARNPEHAISLYHLTDVLAGTGRWRETIAPLRQLAKREPFWPLVRWRLAEALLSSDRVDEAENEVEAALRIWPGMFPLWQMKVRLLLASGRASEALDFATDKSREPANAQPLVKCERAVAAAYGTPSSRLRQEAIESIVAEVRNGLFHLCFPAVTSAFIGEDELAFQMFEGYYLGRGRWRAGATEDPFTFPLFKFETKHLRGDARFAELVRAIGLEAYWKSSGKLPDYRLA